MRVMPCALAQHRLSSAPVWVLQVLRATPVQPNCRPSRISFQSWALSSMNSGLRAETLCTSIWLRLQVVRERLLDVQDHLVDPRMVLHQLIQQIVDIRRVLHGAN